MGIHPATNWYDLDCIKLWPIAPIPIDKKATNTLAAKNTNQDKTLVLNVIEGRQNVPNR